MQNIFQASLFGAEITKSYRKLSPAPGQVEMKKRRTRRDLALQYWRSRRPKPQGGDIDHDRLTSI